MKLRRRYEASYDVMMWRRRKWFKKVRIFFIYWRYMRSYWKRWHRCDTRDPEATKPLKGHYLFIYLFITVSDERPSHIQLLHECIITWYEQVLMTFIETVTPCCFSFYFYKLCEYAEYSRVLIIRNYDQSTSHTLLRTIRQRLQGLNRTPSHRHTLTDELNKRAEKMFR